MKLFPPFRPSPLRVWAVDASSAQICWGWLPAGPVTISTADHARTVDHLGGPGAVTIDHLAPATDHVIQVISDDGRRELTARTLTPPPGEILCRIATVSDLHIGSTRWGFLHTMVDLSAQPEPSPTRCARGAISEAIRWGADHLVIKGDAAHHRRVDHFEALGALLDDFPDLAMTLVPGNHDVDGISGIAVPSTVGKRALPMTRTVAVEDLPGIRIVAVDTSIEHRGIGTLATNGAAALDAAASADGAALVLLHHQLQRHRYPTHHPPGISKREGAAFTKALGSANPDSWVSSGHTHRNRARAAGPVQITEVASTRDWPGVWAGYEIREGGITQTVRRVEANNAITWHEYSRGAVWGLWSMWAPGPLHQRCLSTRWAW